MPTIETLLSVGQVARLTGLSKRTIWRMARESRTPDPVRIGRVVRFRASEVDQWLRLGCPNRAMFNTTKGVRHDA